MTVEVIDTAGNVVTSSDASVAVALAKNPGSTSLAGGVSLHAGGVAQLPR